jgi:ABC-type uncharacterized transport system permease subunit
MFATSWSTELPKEYFQGRHFQKVWNLALMAICFAFIIAVLKDFLTTMCRRRFPAKIAFAMTISTADA